MGRGNTTIRGYDGNAVRTFYVELQPDFENEREAMTICRREEIVAELSGRPFGERRRAVIDMYKTRQLPVRVSEDVVYDSMSRTVDDEIDNLSYEIGALEGFERVTDKDRKPEEILVSGVRECGVVIARSKHCAVVIADNEWSIAIGCVRTLIDDDIIGEELLESAYGKADEELGAGVDIHKKLERAYEILRAGHAAEIEAEEQAYARDANAAMRAVHAYMGKDSMSERSGPWTSSRLPEFDENNPIEYY